MATVTKKPAPAPAPPSTPRSEPWALRALDAIYRFLASLRLAVISLSLLAGTLAVATFIESWYGTGAAQALVYQSAGFALLLAFLGMNILCAALIRFPWTKRQTGFVVTHAGLLVVLFGSFLSVKMADEGQVGMLEGGEPVRNVVRLHQPRIRVQKLDDEGQPTTEYAFPFFGGPFSWSPGRAETITRSDDPFQIKVNRYIAAASVPTPVHEPARDGQGQPSLKASFLVKPPRMAQPYDALADPDDADPNWLVVDNPRIGRVNRDLGPALLAFQYVSGPDADSMVDDFLHPPADPLNQAVARIHYVDKDGQDCVYEWIVGDEKGKSVTLPDSDLVVTLAERIEAPVPPALDPHWVRPTAEGGAVPAVKFRVRKGDGPEVEHYGFACWPMVPSVIPGPQQPAGAKPLVRIGYFHPPEINRDPKQVMSGRFAIVEVMGTPAGKLYYRAFGRNGLGGVGPLPRGAAVAPLGEAATKTMLLSLRADEFLPAAETKYVCQELTLSKAQINDAIPAVEMTLTADGQSQTAWVRRSYDLRSHYQTIELPGGKKYRVAYDFDRKPLGFQFELTDFDVGMDPGTDSPSSYTSEVLLTDEAKNIERKPVTVTMNEPMTHRGWTFYQSNYIPMTDGSGRRTGQFMSVFAARYDPAWQVIYIGCGLVVFGTFLQFYMRAGVFTDGGKRERARAEAKALKAQAKANGQAAPTPAPPSGPAPAAPIEDFEEL